MSRMLQRFWRLIYPCRCVFCEEFLDKTVIEDICPDCAAHLPYTGRRCRSTGEFYTECFSPLYYEGLAAEAIRRYKFRGKSSYCRLMGRMIARCVRENSHSPCDLITWVPISRSRLRKRGYSQAKLLARQASEELGIPSLPLLKKLRNTPPQSSLTGASARKANISGAFAALNQQQISGRDILLIDDVVTTGATLAECARVLLQAGANSVSCATLCRKRPK